MNVVQPAMTSDHIAIALRVEESFGGAVAQVGHRCTPGATAKSQVPQTGAWQLRHANRLHRRMGPAGHAQRSERSGRRVHPARRHRAGRAEVAAVGRGNVARRADHRPAHPARRNGRHSRVIPACHRRAHQLRSDRRRRLRRGRLRDDELLPTRASPPLALQAGGHVEPPPAMRAGRRYLFHHLGHDSLPRDRRWSELIRTRAERRRSAG